MKTYIWLFTLIVLLFASCNIFNSKDKTEEEFSGEASVIINNEEWLHPGVIAEKSLVSFSSGIFKSNGFRNKSILLISIRKGDVLRNNESIVIAFELPENATLEDLEGMKVEYGEQNHSKYKGDNIIFFAEKDYDLSIGIYEHINHDYPAHARITAVDFENEIIEGEFEFSLKVRNMYREEPYTKWRNLPDTLHFTKGYFKLPVEDFRNRD